MKKRNNIAKRLIKNMIEMYVNSFLVKLEPKAREEKVNELLKKWNIPSD